MLLVIISMAMATILTTAYLASRDNSGAIGNNVVEAAVARTASESGLEYGLAILQTESDWRNQHVNGKLVDDLPIAHATLDLDLVDLQTNSPPQDQTKVVLLIATATVGAIDRISTAKVWIDAAAANDEVNVDLSEFAVFARNNIDLKDDALVTRWPSAPGSALGERIAFGTRSADSSAVSVTGQAAAIDTTVFHRGDASAFLIMQSSGPYIGQQALLDPIPLPAPPTAPATATGSTIDIILTGTVASPPPMNYKTVEVNGGIVTLQGDLTLVAEDQFYLQNGGSMLIDGNVTLVSFGGFVMQPGSFIELLPSATLTLFVFGDFDMSGNYIGELRADRLVRDNAGGATYMDPQRIQIFDMGNTAIPTWHLQQNTVVKGSLYGPATLTRVEIDSAVYGRVAADTIELVNNAAIYYDPSLNLNAGYRNASSDLFAPDATIKPAFQNLVSLNDADVDAAATSEQLLVYALDQSFDHRVSGATVPVPPGTPTPRPVAVRIEIQSIGMDVRPWEDKGAGHVMTPFEVAAAADDLAASILAYDANTWVGATSAAKSSLSLSLSLHASTAATQIRAGQYTLALSELNLLYDTLDTQPIFASGALASPERTQLMTTTSRVVSAAEQL